MNKIYIFVPLICLLVFGGFYMQFKNGYTAKIVAAKQTADRERKEREAKLLKDREEANRIAIEMSAQRTKERAEKAKLEEDKKVAKVLAEEKRLQAFDERKRLREQVERLKAELEAVQAVITKNETTKTQHNAEIAFLQDLVKRTESSQKDYYDLLEKIADVEKKAAAAAAAEAASKKS